MKKVYKKPTLTVEAFEFDSIMTGDSIDNTLIQSNLTALVNSQLLVGANGGTINLGDNNTLQSINYKDFILK